MQSNPKPGIFAVGFRAAKMPGFRGETVDRRIGGRRGACPGRISGDLSMEKLVYLLWNESGRADGDLAARLLGPVAGELLALGPAGLSMDVADDEAAAVNLPLPPPADDPSPFALVSIWLGCHDDREPFEAV